MRAIHELVSRIRERFDDPRKKELAGLVSTFRGQIEGLLGEKDTREFPLSAEETQFLRGSWVSPVTITIRRKGDGLRVDGRSNFSGEAIELAGNNKPRFLDIAGSGEEHWEKPREGGDLGTKIFCLQEWILYVTVLEGLLENPQTAPSAPVAP